MSLEEFWNSFQSWAVQWGYLGVFIFSIIANATIILPVPYALAILTLGMAGLNPLWLGIISGVGAAIGELTAYALGYAWRSAMTEERKEKLEKARRLLGKSAVLVIFVFSATPLPVDVISIPVGMMGYPIWKVFPAFLAGKIILCIVIACFGWLFKEFLILISGVGGIFGIIGTLIAIAALVALVLLIDWDEALRIADEEGWRSIFTPEGVKRLLSTIKHRWKSPREAEVEEAAEEDEGSEEGGEEAVEGGG